MPICYPGLMRRELVELSQCLSRISPTTPFLIGHSMRNRGSGNVFFFPGGFEILQSRTTTTAMEAATEGDSGDSGGGAPNVPHQPHCCVWRESTFGDSSRMQQQHNPKVVSERGSCLPV